MLHTIKFIEHINRIKIVPNAEKVICPSRNRAWRSRLNQLGDLILQFGWDLIDLLHSLL